MRYENVAPDSVVYAYANVLRQALLSLRMRVRYGETIDMQELHDITDALENVPQMLCAYGGWNVESNIDWALQRYDDKWCRGERSVSLMRALERARTELAEKGEPDPQEGSE